MKNCISCGMPMNEISEYACGDTSKSYCVHCARPDGSMKSFEEKKSDTISLLTRTQGIDKAVAAQLAESMMSKLPAWQSHLE